MPLCLRRGYEEKIYCHCNHARKRLIPQIYTAISAQFTTIPRYQHVQTQRWCRAYSPLDPHLPRISVALRTAYYLPDSLRLVGVWRWACKVSKTPILIAYI